MNNTKARPLRPPSACDNTISAMAHPGSMVATPSIRNAPDPRSDWIDIAKAVSISLVVLWHTAGPRFYFNEVLILVRMPLFFFLAGMTAQRTLDNDWRKFAVYKVGNLLWLYVVWASLLSAVFGRLPDVLSLALSPPGTLWFIYALAIAFVTAKTVRALPTTFVICCAFVAYCISVRDGNWMGLAFTHRVVRLLPFFLVGLASARVLPKLVNASWRAWPVAATLFGVSAPIVYGNSGLIGVGPVTAFVSALGIFAVLLAARAAETTWLRTPLSFLGRSSLYVYVLHRIPLGTIVVMLRKTGVQGGLPFVLSAAGVTWACAVAGHLASRTRCNLLFVAPWVSRRRAALAASSSGDASRYWTSSAQ